MQLENLNKVFQEWSTKNSSFFKVYWLIIINYKMYKTEKKSIGIKHYTGKSATE